MSTQIEPALRDDAFVADVAAAARAREENDVCHLWWLGQAGFLIGWRDRHLLFDPYLSDSLTRKYRDTDTPHVRMSARVVAPSNLGCVDAIAVSHSHTDHLDAETLQAILAVAPTARMVAPLSRIQLAEERSGLRDERLVGIDSGITAEIAGFSLTAVPAAHEDLRRTSAGHMECLGYVAAFGDFVVYHAGDTTRYTGMEEAVRDAAGDSGVDVALLPINGRAAGSRVPGNMTGTESGALAKALGARLAIPCHFDMFTFNTVSPDEFADTCKLLQQDFVVLELGERLTIRKMVS